MLVDWEYAGMGDPWFDLGNLSVNNGFDDATDERLLDRLPRRARLPSRSARALKLMRIVSDAREGGLGCRAGCVSELDFDFDGTRSEHFERLQAAAASAGLPGMALYSE